MQSHLKKLNLKVTLGKDGSFASFKDEIIPFAKLATDLGVDYGVIKHCSDDEFGILGVIILSMKICILYYQKQS